jgi:hypothetical protein
MNEATIWQIDPAHTTIEFAVKHMMFTTVRGRFKSFSGTVHVDERNPDKSRVEASIDAGSIDTGSRIATHTCGQRIFSTSRIIRTSRSAARESREHTRRKASASRSLAISKSAAKRCQ